MSSLSAIPGYNDLKAQADAVRAQAETFGAQRAAAIKDGNTEAATIYFQQEDQAVNQYLILNNQLQNLILNSENSGQDLASPTVTTGNSQSTPATNARDDGPTQAPTSGGVGAGTSTNAFNSINADQNPLPSRTSNQTVLNTSTANLNQLIPTQPNQLDQYASYTYALSWYVLSPQQYNDMIDSQRPNVTNWQLLMQSGGAPIAGRSPAFSLDYYMDDLEITTRVPFGGTKQAHSAVDIRFKVTEPNGITLIQSLFNAVSSVYKNAQQSQTNTSNNGAPVAKSPSSTGSPNYLQAQYCMVIQFYGYDQNGNLIAPAKGAFNTSSQSGRYGEVAVIKKYYPFRIKDLKFQIANRAIEYTITGTPIAQSYGFTTDRGTVPYPFTMAGSTVEQLLNGSPITVGATSTNTVDPGTRKDSPQPAVVPATLPSIVTGQDNPLATSGGMDFTAGNF